MGLSITSTTKLECDLVQNGKKCDKVFLLPDLPELPTPGSENTVSLVIGSTGQKYYFCCMLHLIAFATAASREAQAKPTGLAAKPQGLTPEQLRMLRDMGIIVPTAPTEPRAHKSVEEIESLTQIPPPPEDLNI